MKLIILISVILTDGLAQPLQLLLLLVEGALLQLGLQDLLLLHLQLALLLQLAVPAGRRHSQQRAPEREEEGMEEAEKGQPLSGKIEMSSL